VQRGMENRGFAVGMQDRGTSGKREGGGKMVLSNPGESFAQCAGEEAEKEEEEGKPFTRHKNLHIKRDER